MQTLTHTQKKPEAKTPTGLYKSGENWTTNTLRHLETQPFTLQRSVCVNWLRRIKQRCSGDCCDGVGGGDGVGMVVVVWVVMVVMGVGL